MEAFGGESSSRSPRKNPSPRKLCHKPASNEEDAKAIQSGSDVGTQILPVSNKRNRRQQKRERDDDSPPSMSNKKKSKLQQEESKSILCGVQEEQDNGKVTAKRNTPLAELSTKYPTEGNLSSPAATAGHCATVVKSCASGKLARTVRTVSKSTAYRKLPANKSVTACETQIIPSIGARSAATRTVGEDNVSAKRVHEHKGQTANPKGRPNEKKCDPRESAVCASAASVKKQNGGRSGCSGGDSTKDFSNGCENRSKSEPTKNNSSNQALPAKEKLCKASTRTKNLSATNCRKDEMRAHTIVDGIDACNTDLHSSNAATCTDNDRQKSEAVAQKRHVTIVTPDSSGGDCFAAVSKSFSTKVYINVCSTVEHTDYIMPLDLRVSPLKSSASIVNRRILTSTVGSSTSGTITDFVENINSTERVSDQTSPHSPDVTRVDVAEPHQQATPERPEIDPSIKQLTEDLFSLNQQCSNVTTHVYRRQTPKRKRIEPANQKRSFSTPRKVGGASSSTVAPIAPDDRLKLKSPRTTPRRRSMFSPTSTKKKPTGKTPVKRPDVFYHGDGDERKEDLGASLLSQMKFPTPSKSKTKRKLYIESPVKFVVSLDSEFGDLSKSWQNDTADKHREGTSSALHGEPGSPADCLRMDIHDDNTCDKSLGDSFVIDETIDKVLEEKSQKINLTARNVRSIIHELITNDQVKEMVRNTLQEGSLESQLKEAIFEPKMTRSKLKEVIEKGQVPPPWALSPVKPYGTTQEVNFLEMSFPDEEEDEEYKPNESELEPDTEDESMLSSQASECGSPRSRRLATPTSSASGSPRRRRNAATPHHPAARSTPLQATGGAGLKTREEELTLTPTCVEMGPPAVPKIPVTSSAACHVDDDDDDDDATVALRTRSKLPLVHLPLDVIEASFVAPDITADLYDTHCDDHDWQTFLAGLSKDDVTGLNDTAEEEANDPEYDFLGELDRDEDDDDELEEERNDRAVHVSKKEWSELMNEVFAGCKDMADFSEVNDLDAKLRALTADANAPSPMSVDSADVNNAENDVESYPDGAAVKKGSSDDRIEEEKNDETSRYFGYPGHIPPLKMDRPLVNVLIQELIKIKDVDDVNYCTTVAPASPAMSVNEQRQLCDQMLKHVQLLAQTFVQAAGNDELENVSASTKFYLEELKSFAEKSVCRGGRSFFYAENLDAALEVTTRTYDRDNKQLEDLLCHSVVEREKIMTSRTYALQGLSYKQMETFVTSPCFVFPEMIPLFSFYAEDDALKKMRIYFSTAEDNLLAMGADQFGELHSKYSFIRDFLLPTKTQNQLMFRYKNLKSTRTPDNAVKYLVTHNRLPEFPKFLYDPDAPIRAPIDGDVSRLPRWYRAYEQARLSYAEASTTMCWTKKIGNSTAASAVAPTSLTKTLSPAKSSLQRGKTGSLSRFSKPCRAEPVKLRSQQATITAPSPVPAVTPACPLLLVCPPTIPVPLSAATVIRNNSVNSAIAAPRVGCTTPIFVNGLQVLAMPSPTVQASSAATAEIDYTTYSTVNFDDLRAVDEGNNQLPSSSLKSQVTMITKVKPIVSNAVLGSSVFLPKSSAQSDLCPASTNQVTLTRFSSTVTSLASGWSSSAQSAFLPLPSNQLSTDPTFTVMSQPTANTNSGPPVITALQQLINIAAQSGSANQVIVLTPAQLQQLGILVGVPPLAPTLGNVGLDGMTSVVTAEPSQTLTTDNSILPCLPPISLTTIVNANQTTAGSDITVSADSFDFSEASSVRVGCKTPEFSRSNGPPAGMSTPPSKSDLISQAFAIAQLIGESPQKSPIMSPVGFSFQSPGGTDIDLFSHLTGASPSPYRPAPNVETTMRDITSTTSIVNDETAYRPTIDVINVSEDASVVVSESPAVINMSENMSVINMSEHALVANVSEDVSVINMSEDSSVVNMSDNALVANISGNASTVLSAPSPMTVDVASAVVHDGRFLTVSGTSAPPEEALNTIESTFTKTNSAAKNLLPVFASVTNSVNDIEESSNWVNMNIPTDPIMESNEDAINAVDTVIDCSPARTVEIPIVDATCKESSLFVEAKPIEAKKLIKRVRPVRTFRSYFLKKFAIKPPRSIPLILPKNSTRGQSIDSFSISSNLLSPSKPKKSEISLRPKIRAIAPRPSLFMHAATANVHRNLHQERKAVEGKCCRTLRSIIPKIPVAFPIEFGPREQRRKVMHEGGGLNGEIDSSNNCSGAEPHIAFGGEVGCEQLIGEVKCHDDKNEDEEGDEADVDDDEEDDDVVGEDNEGAEVENYVKMAPITGTASDSPNECESDDPPRTVEQSDISPPSRIAPKGLRMPADLQKRKKEKEMMVAMFESSLVDNDYSKDDRDTLFAMSYQNKVRAALKDNVELYDRFLQLLVNFSHSEQSATQLYRELASLLHGYPKLVEDFAAFLLPGQAVDCGCFMAQQEFSHARAFMCKLEIFFRKNPTRLQKVMKLFHQWQDGTVDDKSLKATVLPLIRNSSHLSEEFLMFFEDERPPPQSSSQFEEIALLSSDDEGFFAAASDNFETVQLTDDSFGFKEQCSCTCHDRDHQNTAYKLRHCSACRHKFVRSSKTSRPYSENRRIHQSHYKKKIKIMKNFKNVKRKLLNKTTRQLKTVVEADSTTVDTSLPQASSVGASDSLEITAVSVFDSQTSNNRYSSPNLSSRNISDARNRDCTYDINLSKSIHAASTETASGTVGDAPVLYAGSVCTPTSGDVLNSEELSMLNVSNMIRKDLIGNSGLMEDVIDFAKRNEQECEPAATEQEQAAKEHGKSADQVGECVWTKDEDRVILEKLNELESSDTRDATIKLLIITLKRRTKEQVTNRICVLRKLLSEIDSTDSTSDSDCEDDV